MPRVLDSNKMDILIRHQIINLLREVFTDPDFGLELNTSVVKRLRKSECSKKAGKYKTLDEIRKKYNDK